jgi:iron complex outermembrane receptor protein
MRSRAAPSRGRRWLLTGAALLVLACNASLAAPDRLALNIKAGNAVLTLADFVRQTGLQVLFESDAIRDHSTRAIKGRFAAAEALRLMLDGSGLVYEFVNDRTVTVKPEMAATQPAAKPDTPAPAAVQRL